MIKGKRPTAEKLTPPRPPLSGGEQKDCLSPPLTRGGREGLAFLPYNKNLTALARENRKNPTPSESKIWNEVLRMRQFADYKFLRQKPIAGYIVDSYCSELRLVIEVDGDSHAQAVEYDAERTRVLQSLGLIVIRYSNDDVIQNIEGVYADLSERVKKLTPLGPPLSGGKMGTLPDKGGRGVGCLEEADADD